MGNAPLYSRRDILVQLTFLPVVQASTTGLFADESKNKLPAKAITKGPKHHFFGYYDKCPWDKTERYLLGMQIGFFDRQPNRGEALTIGMIDLQEKERWIPLDETSAWSWQQGTMLQWLGSTPEKEIIYNSVTDKQYVSIIRDVHSGKTRTLPKPIYAVSNDGKQAVGLPFDRLHRLRPGYGYCALDEEYADDPAPEKIGIYWMDITSGKHQLIVPIARLAKNKVDPRLEDAQHWVNHCQFNPSGNRFLFLHRWKKKLDKTWSTRLYTCKPDGTELHLLIDTGMVSHFDWLDDETVLAWSRHKSHGDKFYLWKIGSETPQALGLNVLTKDGHCSYSPNRKWILNDTYPDTKRLQWLMLFDPKTGRRYDLNQFYLDPKLTGPFRCDLHPRWNRSGTQVCIDSAHDGTRQLYVIDVTEIVKG